MQDQALGAYRATCFLFVAACPPVLTPTPSCCCTLGSPPKYTLCPCILIPGFSFRVSPHEGRFLAAKSKTPKMQPQALWTRSKTADVPGGPVVRTPCFHCRLGPKLGNEDPTCCTALPAANKQQIRSGTASHRFQSRLLLLLLLLIPGGLSAQHRTVHPPVSTDSGRDRPPPCPSPLP